jgi:excisionase family DNA binding protein
MHPPLLWSLDEVTHQLGDISRRSVLRLIERGELPSVKVGRRVMIPAHTVHEWVDQRMKLADNHSNAGLGVRRKEKNACHTDAKTVPIGGFLSSTQVDKELDALLTLRTEKKPNS